MRSFLKSLPSMVRRRHRGSVLILVVVMVVLLALLGTALLSTSRGDRFTSTQHVANTQIDLLVEGVKDLAKAKIAAGLQGAEGFRPAMDTKATLVAKSFANFDAPNFTLVGAPTDERILGRDWLSMRTPSAEFSGGTEVVYWPIIGAPLTGSTAFESPMVLTAAGNQDPTLSPKFEDRVSTNFVVNQPEFRATSIREATTGVVYPAFNFRATVNGVRNATAGNYLAADADGDGIADSGYFKLPVGTLDGLTYYAAVRIVDSSSAININTAGSRAYDRLLNPPPAGTPQPNAGDPCDALPPANGFVALAAFADNLGWFHSHVGLQELLNRQNRPAADADIDAYRTFAAHTGEPNAQAEMLALDRYRLGYNTSNNGLTRGTVTGGNIINIDGSYQPTPVVPPYTPIPPSVYNVAIAAYLSEGDVLEHTIAHRMRNVGLNQLFVGGPALTRAFSLSDAAALAYHNGTLINTDAGLSVIDSTFYNARNLDPLLAGAALPDSIYSSAANYTQNSTHPAILSGSMTGRTAYNAGDSDKWFDDNYFADAPDPTPVLPAITYNNIPPVVPPKTLTKGGKYRTLRPYVTTWNPVGNLEPLAAFDSQFVAGANGDAAANGPWIVNLPPINTNVMRPTMSKTSINTALFPELWLAFQHVMAETTVTGAAAGYDANTPFVTAATATADLIAPASRADIYVGEQFINVIGDAASPGSTNVERMFRSSLRDGVSIAPVAPLCFSPKAMVALRSALAATQTEQMRVNSSDTPQQVIHQIDLQGRLAAAQPKLTVTMFGQIPQPFITEVFVSGDYTSGARPNPDGYVAIELYNPFNTAIDLGGYEFIMVDRGDGAVQSLITAAGGIAPDGGNVAPCHLGAAFPAGTMIAANGYLVIDNLGPNGDAQYRPPAAMGAAATQTRPFERALGRTALYPPQRSGKEVILRRPYTGAAAMPLVGAPALAAYQPIDSFDFYGINLDAPRRTFDYHYNRPSGPAVNWQCVYPGRYFAPEASAVNHRHQGTDYVQYDSTIVASPWAGGITGVNEQPVNFGGTKPLPGYDLAAAAAPIIQLSNLNTNQPGPNPILGAPTKFPFGGFAREADMLQVPFIGAYVVQDAMTGDVYEMNSISMDAAFAEDTDVVDDPQQATPSQPHEQIGHFCPIANNTNMPSLNRDDLSLATTGGYSQAGAGNIWNYRWATKLFTYLTVHNSQTDYLPDFDPAQLITNPLAAPSKIDNDGDSFANGGLNKPEANGNLEDLDPAQGLININTAPWRVLASLPMLKTGNNLTYTPATESWAVAADPNPVDDNVKLAKAIVLWRDGNPLTGALPNGPFKSIFDLYRVPAFQNAQITLLAGPFADPNSGPAADQGDFSATDLARNDYEEQYLLLNRISNLVTTRSDSFVVYVLVQGWRGVGDTNFKTPQLVVQRRVAFIQDRYGVYKASAPLNTPINVPNE